MYLKTLQQGQERIKIEVNVRLDVSALRLRAQILMTCFKKTKFVNCLPPMLELKATPTPQIPLPDSAATSPAHFVPWLKSQMKKHSRLRINEKIAND